MRTLLHIAAALAVYMSASTAVAQANCATRSEAVPLLEEKFKEAIVGRGLANEGKLMVEVFVSAEGTWTVLLSDPKGISCVIASGKDWQEVHGLLGDAT